MVWDAFIQTPIYFAHFESFCFKFLSRFDIFFNWFQLSEYRIKMSDQEDMVALGRWTINRRLLPIKLFYFFMMAGECTYSAGITSSNMISVSFFAIFTFMKVYAN